MSFLPSSGLALPSYKGFDLFLGWVGHFSFGLFNIVVQIGSFNAYQMLHTGR